MNMFQCKYLLDTFWGLSTDDTLVIPPLVTFHGYERTLLHSFHRGVAPYGRLSVQVVLPCFSVAHAVRLDSWCQADISLVFSLLIHSE